MQELIQTSQFNDQSINSNKIKKKMQKRYVEKYVNH
jgi:hypothetical protein